jgi:hypothetical protein
MEGFSHEWRHAKHFESASQVLKRRMKMKRGDFWGKCFGPDALQQANFQVNRFVFRGHKVQP